MRELLAGWQAIVFKGAISPMQAMLDRDVPQLAGALRRMSEHLAEYLRGPEGTAEMLQLLGESPSGGMARGGTDEAPASADGTPTGGAEAEASGNDAGIGGAP